MGAPSSLWLTALLLLLPEIARAQEAVFIPACVQQAVNWTTWLPGLSSPSRQVELLAVLSNCVNTAAVCGLPVPPPPPFSTPDTPRPNRGSSDDERTIALGVTIPILGVLVLISAGLLARRFSTKTTRRNLWGRVKPPPPGPDTTLVITDIEGSTSLWEQLDESVMDLALHLHHACMRKHITASVGVEAQVEGDSFVVAFHNVNDAVTFCMAVQEALMHIAWPEDLLKAELCKPFYTTHIKPPDTSERPTHTSTAGDMMPEDDLVITPPEVLLAYSADGSPYTPHDDTLQTGVIDIQGSDTQHASSRQPPHRQLYYSRSTTQQSQDGRASAQRPAQAPPLPPAAPPAPPSAPNPPAQAPASAESLQSVASQDDGAVTEAASINSRIPAEWSDFAVTTEEEQSPPVHLSPRSATFSAKPISHLRGPSRLGRGALGLDSRSLSPQNLDEVLDVQRSASSMAEPSRGVSQSGIVRESSVSPDRLVSQDSFNAGGATGRVRPRISPPLQGILRKTTGEQTGVEPGSAPVVAPRHNPSTRNGGLRIGARRQASVLQWADRVAPGPATGGAGDGEDDALHIAPRAASMSVATRGGSLPQVFGHGRPNGVSFTNSPLSPNSHGVSVDKSSRRRSLPLMTSASGTGQDAQQPPATPTGHSSRFKAKQSEFSPYSDKSAVASELTLAASMGDLLVKQGTGSLEESDPVGELEGPMQSRVLDSATPPSSGTMYGPHNHHHAARDSSAGGQPEDSTADGAKSSWFRSTASSAMQRTTATTGVSTLSTATTKQSFAMLPSAFRSMAGAAVRFDSNTQAAGQAGADVRIAIDTDPSTQSTPVRHSPGRGAGSSGGGSRAQRAAASGGWAQRLWRKMSGAFNLKQRGNLHVSDSVQEDNSSPHLTSPRVTAAGAQSVLAPLVAGLRVTQPTSEPQAAACDPYLLSRECNKSFTVLDTLQGRLFECGVTDPGATLMFRGLRVRMGVHTGFGTVEGDDGKINPNTKRPQYSGPSFTLCKYVCDSACGGMILLSASSLPHVDPDMLQNSAMAIHMGDHVLARESAPISLHQIISRSLMGRLPILDTPRSLRICAMGALDAPAGYVTVCFMHVVGEATLMAWNPEIAELALSIFQDKVGQLLHKLGGYLVEGAHGFVLASFTKASSAVRWALQCVQELKIADWPADLLRHELGEEMVTRTPDLQAGVMRETIMLRGLRIRAGLDCGRLHGEIACLTGRMSYRGRYMNRAARIAAVAGTGQILASADVTAACSGTMAAHRYTATSLGLQRFKGVAGPVEVFDMQPNNLALLTKRASLALSSVAGDMLDQLSMVDRSSANTARSSQAGWALGSSRLSRLNRSSATSQYSSIDIAAYPSRQPSVAQYSTMSHSSVRRSVLEGQYAVAPGMDGASGGSQLERRRSRSTQGYYVPFSTTGRARTNSTSSQYNRGFNTVFHPSDLQSQPSQLTTGGASQTYDMPPLSGLALPPQPGLASHYSQASSVGYRAGASGTAPHGPYQSRPGSDSGAIAPGHPTAAGAPGTHPPPASRHASRRSLIAVDTAGAHETRRASEAGLVGPLRASASGAAQASAVTTQASGHTGVPPSTQSSLAVGDMYIPDTTSPAHTSQDAPGGPPSLSPPPMSAYMPGGHRMVSPHMAPALMVRPGIADMLSHDDWAGPDVNAFGLEVFHETPSTEALPVHKVVPVGAARGRRLTTGGLVGMPPAHGAPAAPLGHRASLDGPEGLLGRAARTLLGARGTNGSVSGTDPAGGARSSHPAIKTRSSGDAPGHGGNLVVVTGDSSDEDPDPYGEHEGHGQAGASSGTGQGQGRNSKTSDGFKAWLGRVPVLGSFARLSPATASTLTSPTSRTASMTYLPHFGAPGRPGRGLSSAHGSPVGIRAHQRSPSGGLPVSRAPSVPYGMHHMGEGEEAPTVGAAQEPAGELAPHEGSQHGSGLLGPSQPPASP